MRKAYRRPVSVGGRDHTSHRLVALGLSERKAVLLLYALSAAGGAMAFLSNRLSTPIAVAILPLFVLAVFVVVTFIARVPVYRPVASADQAQGLALVPTLAEFAYKRRVFEVLFDLATVLLAYYAAFLLHYEGRLPQPEYRHFLDSMPAVVVAQITTFLAMGLYRGMWGYATLEDTARIVRSVLLSVTISVALCWALFGLHRFSRVVHIIDALLLLFAIAGSRISFRLIRDWIVGGRARGKATLIYGAGAGGELLVRELRANLLFGLDPIGFIDDEPRKVGKQVVGLPVLGTAADLEAVIKDKGISTLVYSTSKIDAARKESITQRCSKLGVEQRMLKVSLDGP
jgi:UDP-GlcNAc:undecaprenyl-phosphate GlcNAc-1-phosphate transferase